MKLVRTEDAVGQVLCHDITQIIPGVVKDAVFRKGHIVTKKTFRYFYLWEKRIFISGKNRKVCFMKMRRLRSCVRSVRVSICILPG